MRQLPVWGLVFVAFAASVAVAAAEPATQSPQTSEPATTPTHPATQPSPASSEQDADLDKVVCKKVTVTGTLIGAKKVCKKKREWAQIERDSQEALRRSQDGSLRSNPSSGGGS